MSCFVLVWGWPLVNLTVDWDSNVAFYGESTGPKILFEERCRCFTVEGNITVQSTAGITKDHLQTKTKNRTCKMSFAYIRVRLA